MYGPQLRTTFFCNISILVPTRTILNLLPAGIVLPTAITRNLLIFSYAALLNQHTLNKLELVLLKSSCN